MNDHTHGALALVPEPPTLDEVLDVFGSETATDEQRAAFTIDTDEKAHWAARKLRSIHDKIAANDDLKNAEIDKIILWADSVNKPLHAEAEFFEGALRFHHETLVRDELAENPDWKKVKTKSKKLLHGVTLAARKPGDEWTFDAETFIPWADEHVPAAVRRKPAPAAEVDVNAAKAALVVTPDGTVVGPGGVIADGVTVKQAAPTFGVKIEG